MTGLAVVIMGVSGCGKSWLILGASNININHQTRKMWMLLRPSLFMALQQTGDSKILRFLKWFRDVTLKPDFGIALTVAALLAETLGCSFIEADDYHSQANKAKMSKGIPLTDDDRIPWLESLRDAMRERLDGGEDVAVSCSALQQKYREILREGDSSYRSGSGSYSSCRVKFVCLEASAEVIAERIRRRSMEGEHFMPASLLQSQLDLLRIDEAEGITEVDATVRPDAIVKNTIVQFREQLASTVC
ncbi:gluconokinase isoform X2 [Oryza brachyantha]|uniref:gluconokinase isoform X2 n=1 Tax=Oryza brachyantha TaxID=4533 RepID=UPI0007765997|nr:gluconokinase isoform X2 [Oryza brachyantha]